MLVNQVKANVLGAIGNTPVVRLQKLVSADSADVLVKLEYTNPTGSYKDRMALAMIEEAEKRGDLMPGMTVVEYTGGSTGSSLAFICAVKGYRFHVVSSNAFSTEKLQTMKAFGAKLLIVHSESGVTTPDLIPRMMAEAQKLAKADDCYFTNQIYNTDIITGYRNIGVELLQQLDQPVDAFCGSVGTAGMLMGVATELRNANPKTKIIALEPASTAVISGGKAGAHDVEGIGIGMVPPLLDRKLYDEVRAIDESAARKVTRQLAEQEGIFSGTSSGMNVAAALELAKELGKGKTVVTVAVDTGLKYLASSLYSD
jgi:cysteine synthase A